jgi:glycosyltransferase involved in cell wall biosynthesis
MKVLIITPEYTGFGGGIVTFYREMAAGLVQQGCEVTILEGSSFSASASTKFISDCGVRVEFLEAARISKYFGRLSHLASLTQLRRMIAAAWAAAEQIGDLRRFDVVEASDFGLLGLAPICARSVPVMMQGHASYGQIHLHDPVEGLEAGAAAALALESWLYSVSDGAQSSSFANCAYWSKQSGRSVQNIYPAYRVPEPNVRGTVSNKISVFGRIQRWKGPYLLAEALRLVPAAPTVVWHGRDVAASLHEPSTDAVLRRTYPEVWGHRIRTVPPIPPAEVAHVQAASLLNLVPSTWDVFNFTVVEAMCSGRPVICSNGVGASELVQDGETGFVFENGSPESLAAALDRALSLPHERLRRVGRAARAYVAHELEPGTITLRRLAAYEAAIKAHSGSTVNVPDWVHMMTEPRGNEASPAAFLSQLPLREILQHARSRVLQKVRSRR